MNCQLYRGWRLGKRNPGVIPDGEGLVDAAGESIEIWGVGLCQPRVLGLVPLKETAPGLLTFAMKPFGRRQLDSVRVAATILGKVVAMHCTMAWGAELVLVAKKGLEAKGRDDRGFMFLSPTLATSVAKVLFVTQTPCLLLFFFFLYHVLCINQLLGTKTTCSSSYDKE